MNIKDKVECAECTSCQMCAAVCSKVAIEIKLNEDGFYRPYVDEERCVDCGLCVKICRKFDNSISPFGFVKIRRIHNLLLLTIKFRLRLIAKIVIGKSR